MKSHKEMSIVSLPAAISIHRVLTVGEWDTKAMLDRKSLRKLNPGVGEKGGRRKRKQVTHTKILFPEL